MSQDIQEGTKERNRKTRREVSRESSKEWINIKAAKGSLSFNSFGSSIILTLFMPIN
jgi:hypothetical protein